MRHVARACYGLVSGMHAYLRWVFAGDSHWAGGVRVCYVAGWWDAAPPPRGGEEGEEEEGERKGACEEEEGEEGRKMGEDEGVGE